MSGIEVVALVAGIVSAFAGAGSLFSNWRRDRKERQKQEKNQQLEQALVKGSSDVQRTYDDDFRRLGPMFARGDGMTSSISAFSLSANAILFVVEIGRNILAEQLIKLQGTVISVLTGNTPISALVYPDHDLLSNTSIAVRLRSLSALADQFQRMSQAAPITAPPALRPIRECDGVISLAPLLGQYQCLRCSWTAIRTKKQTNKHRSCVGTFLEYFHATGGICSYRCALCNLRTPRDGPSLKKHLADAHGFDLDKEAQNNEDGCMYHRLAAYLRAGEETETANWYKSRNALTESPSPVSQQY